MGIINIIIETQNLINLLKSTEVRLYNSKGNFKHSETPVRGGNDAAWKALSHALPQLNVHA